MQLRKECTAEKILDIFEAAVTHNSPALAEHCLVEMRSNWHEYAQKPVCLLWVPCTALVTLHLGVSRAA